MGCCEGPKADQGQRGIQGGEGGSGCMGLAGSEKLLDVRETQVRGSMGGKVRRGRPAGREREGESSLPQIIGRDWESRYGGVKVGPLSLSDVRRRGQGALLGLLRPARKRAGQRRGGATCGGKGGGRTRGWGASWKHKGSPGFRLG